MSTTPDSAKTSPAAPAPAAAPASPKRKLLMLSFGALVVLGAVGYGVWWNQVARYHEGTDDAYVQGNLVQITPQIAGTVVSIHADDTDFVKAGTPLVDLDRADAQIALDQARASLAQTVRQVRTLYTGNGALAATIDVRNTEIKRAQTELTRAQADLKRRQELGNSGAVSGEELLHAQSAVDTARAALTAAQAGLVGAREQLASNTALTDGTRVEDHPNVALAASKVREAYLNWSRAELPAPVSGYVAKRAVQLGQRVAPGSTMMSIVPLDQVWVDANFKEVQLRDTRIGQPVKLVADLYGDKVEYHGTIAGLAAGTGSAFSLLPAQNATGNWIKIVQRLPVRIALDPKEIAEHPLRVGLSMAVDVNITDTSGPTLAQGKRSAVSYSTQAFDAGSPDADRMVSETIAANLANAPAAVSQAGNPAASTSQQNGKTAPAAQAQRQSGKAPQALASRQL